jgi:hypothetical protein
LINLAGALYNWNWFYCYSWSAFLDKALGRTAARIFFALVGAALVGRSLSFAFF